MAGSLSSKPSTSTTSISLVAGHVQTSVVESDEIIELTPAVSDSYRGIGVRAPAGMSCPAGQPGLLSMPWGLAYLFPEF